MPLSKMIGFVATNDPEKAKAFYETVLGFRLITDDEFALVFDANGTQLRVVKGRTIPPAPGTVLGWEVDDVHASIRELAARGVTFEQWKLPFMKQDADGVWTPREGNQVAWFKDPDGNVLSISHHAHRPATAAMA